MAGVGPSQSPSGSNRRLSELLDQQQEPFSLDIYLLERGCSPAFFDAAIGGGGGGACSTCWPRPRTRCAGRMPVRPAASKKVSCTSGVLRLLLCAVLRGKMTPAKAAKKKQLRLPTINRRHFDVGGDRQRMPRDHENSVPPLHPAAEGSTVKAEEVKDDKDNDRNKRLSPVSVLEQRPLQHSPSTHEQKALLIFRKLLQAAYSPMLLNLVADANHSSRSRSRNSKNSSTKTSSGAARNNHAHWEEEGVFEEALAEVSSLVASEMAGARAAWPEDVQQERRDVGADIAVAMLDALVEETGTELMTGTDPDFAVDTARRHCWC